jgi:hypothetical protein
MARTTHPSAHARINNHTGILKRIWRWTNRNSSPLLVVVAIVAAFGGFPGIYSGVSRSWNYFHPKTITSQSILALAESWRPIIYLNDGQGALTKNWVTNNGNSANAEVAASKGLLNVYVKPGHNGGYSFLLDEAEDANLPAGDYFLSAEVVGSPGCSFGLTFNAEQTSARLAWLYVDNTDGTRYGLEVAPPSGDLSDAFHEIRYYQPIDNIGVVHYGSDYVLELNGVAVRTVNSSVLTRLDKNISMTAPGIGVGMYTCPHRGTIDYEFGGMELQTP